MISELDAFYEQLEEPLQSCFLALREIIPAFDPDITEAWKYKLPFFDYKKKFLCYLWKDKKGKQAYIGFVDGREIDHPALKAQGRKRIKILPIYPNEDIDVPLLYELLAMAIEVKNNKSIR